MLEKELLAREIEKIAGQENVKLDEPMKPYFVQGWRTGGYSGYSRVCFATESNFKIMQKQKRSGVCYGQRNKLDCKR